MKQLLFSSVAGLAVILSFQACSPGMDPQSLVNANTSTNGLNDSNSSDPQPTDTQPNDSQSNDPTRGPASENPIEAMAVQIPSSCAGYYDTDVFNAAAYRKYNGDLATKTDDELRLHWCVAGMKEGRQASEVFRSKEYLAMNAKLIEAIGSTDYVMASYYFVNSPSLGRAAGYPGLRIGAEPIFNRTAYQKYNPAKIFATDHEARRDFLLNGLPLGLRGSETFAVKEYYALYPTQLAKCVANGQADYRCMARDFLDYGLAAGRKGASSSPFETWAALVSKDTISPVAAETGDLVKTWTAPDTRTIKVVVKQPKPATTVALTMAAIPAGADARPYFERAIEQVKAQKAATLIIPKAIYTFKTISADGLGHWVMKNLSDVTIDGQGSTLVFAQNKNGIHMVSVSRVKVSNLTLKYSIRTSSLGQIVLVGTEKVLKVDSRYKVTAADGAHQIAEYDSAANLWVPKGERVILPPDHATPAVYRADIQSYASAAFKYLTVGKKFSIHHHFYGGIALTIADQRLLNPSEDVIIDGVTITSSPGMGIVAYGIKRGFAVTNSSFVTDADGLNLMSNEYDAIHVQLVAGDVIIANNLISRQGDDAVNINSPVTPVRGISADGKTLQLETYSRFIAQNDRVTFFNPTGEYLGTAVAVTNPRLISGLLHEVTFDRAIPGLTTSSLARDLNVTTTRVAMWGNTVKDCHCHGVLLQVPNTLFEQNTVESTSANAIRLLTNTGSFKEGVGAFNNIVRNNIIRNSGADSSLPIPWAAISLYGAINGGVTASPVHKDVQISGNRVIGARQACVMVTSSVDVRVSSNTCESTNTLTPGSPSLHFEKSRRLTILGNQKVGGTTGPINVDRATVTELVLQSAY